MKTSLVIASVLLAGVAFEAAAFRIDNNENQGDGHKQWLRSQQEDSFAQNGDRFPCNENRDQYDRKSNRDSYNDGNDDYDDDKRMSRGDFQNSGPVQQQQRSAGLTGSIVQKIAAVQEIARDGDVAGRAAYLDGALSVHKNSVKLTGKDFVTFYNTTMKHLDGGELEYLYISPGRDVVLAQYRFDRVDAVGSFKSNVRHAAAGYYAVAMHGVSCNVTVGLDNERHADVRPARFRFADATLRTADGAETQFFDGALERTYLGTLEKAVSAEAAKSVGRGVIAQMKRVVGEPMAFHGAGGKGKLFDVRWKEDDVSVEVSNVGYRNPETVAEPIRFSSVSFYRKPGNAHRMRYHFTLNDLEWSSPLTVQSAGKRTSVRSADFNIDEVNVFVSIDQPDGQRQLCGQIYTNAEVTGLRYDFNENVQSEFMTEVQNKLQRIIEHSLENYVQESLKQQLCQNVVQ